MKAEKTFKEFLSRYFPNKQYGKWLIAISGGLDSVVLAHLCKQHDISIVLAHCNFGLRGPESMRDEEFVKNLAGQWGVELCCRSFETEVYAAKHKLSIQVAARQLRYAWFEEIIKEQGELPAQNIDVLATAHHADDNAETALFNMFRGCGLQGARGMQPRQAGIIRPLLAAAKNDLLEYASANNLTWVEDSSNSTDKYSRNYIRHQVLPLMSNVFAEATQNFSNTLAHLREAEILYRQALEIHLKKMLVHKANEVHVPVLKLLKAAPLHTIIHEIIHPYGFGSADTASVETLCHSETGRYISSATHRIIKNRHWLIIAPLHSEAATHVLIEPQDSRVLFAEGALNMQIVGDSKQRTPPVGLAEVWLDANDIKFPLLLRPWKQGDYFYPLGMEKKKKVARFLIDQKLSKTEKEKIWVLESNKKVLWIVGQRIDNRFKITEATQKILKLRFDASETPRPTN